jgi:hypothetical protein
MRSAIIALLLIPSLCLASNYTLDITNVDEAGANNRILFAYPGIEYKVAISAIGGTYPFVWELTSYPSGMSIDAHTGIITWASPTATGSPHTVTVKVTDTEGNTDTESYTLTVTSSTDRFIWMDAATEEAIGNRTGAIDHPFKNFSDFWTLGSHGYKICIMRAGTYDFTDVTGTNSRGHGSYRVEAAVGSVPIAYVGYPGETVNFSGTRDWNGTNTGKHWALAAGSDRYYQNINFISAYGYSFEVIGDNDRCTIFDCTFNDLVPSPDYQNDAFISLALVGLHEKWVIAFSDFSDAAETYGSAIKTYTTSQMIVQGCTFTDINDMAINWKAATYNSVARHNTFTRCDTAIGLSGYVEGGVSCHDNEVCFNYITGTDQTVGVYCNSAGTIEHLHIYRNTFNNDYIIFRLYGIDDDAHSIYNNVIINPLTDTAISGEDFIQNKCRFRYLTSGSESTIYTNNFTFSNNLLGVAADGILDISGNLANQANVGTYGWEIAESEYYGASDTTPPTPTISTSGPITSTDGTATVEFSCTANCDDLAGYKWRIGSAPDASNGTTCTSPATITGLSVGSNTVYIGAGDAAGNWGSDSITVNYSPVATTISIINSGIRGGGGVR